MNVKFEGYRKYLEDMTKCYPGSAEIAGMTKLYNGLIDIWYHSEPDNLLPLFSFDRLAKGTYMFETEKIKEVTFTNSGYTAMKVFALMKEHGLKGTETMTDLSLEGAVEFIRESLSQEDRYSNVLMKWILKPSFITAIGEINIDPLLLKDREAGNRCPLCNAPPGMAIIDKINNVEQRYLSCCFCGYRWTYDLSGCPNCGNSKPERLSLFVGNAGCEQGTRAPACDECRTYLKTAFLSCREDKRSFHDLDMDIEDVATIPLDIIASRHSYAAICQGR